MKEIIKNEKIENLIYEVRGVQVMLDSDLAKLYDCKNGTKTINQAVKRHFNKFPNRYMFQLTIEEHRNICGPKLGPQTAKIRSLPFVFTEQGVAMLATILHTDIADEISMKIIDAFVYMRKYISSNLLEQKHINDLVLEDHEKIKILESSFDKFKSKQSSIIYEGKIYDAYSILLDILRNINKRVIILSKNYNEELIKKYKTQYDNIEFVNNNSFHDRYIILDKKEAYISGMSLKDIGKQYSYINKVNEEIFIDELLKRIDKILQ